VCGECLVLLACGFLAAFVGDLFSFAQNSCFVILVLKTLSTFRMTNESDFIDFDDGKLSIMSRVCST
jgi:hypothetical protein